MSTDVKYTKGTRVVTDEHGAGVVSLIDSAPGADGPYTVYHVRLDSGETRHFTEEQLSEE